ncbi:YHS domain-containing protein [Clostridium tyrobutyricum]|uniref:YHS domain-containing protein n=1 Tax=Clostridium tyrobutyricum TaxID=1519 RepID=UPI002B1F4992|nr:YHS domain-containing protein [Clostridium tyrobutyricum]MEA5009053.1 YHS domain-containing protein [Clostridium tyrobutyricum]
MEFIASNWLYILFAGVMVFMMVKGGGCCGGHSHETNSGSSHSHGGGCCGGGSEHNHNNENIHQANQLESVKDPICGMMVNPDIAIKQTINGQTYYFCSESCRREFVRKQS